MFELLDVPMRLKYYFNGRVTDAGPARFNESWYDDWLASMVKVDVIIFFLVTETTDVFEKEWDFNEYAHSTRSMYSHAEESHHQVVDIFNEPGWRCLECDERSPAWDLKNRQLWVHDHTKPLFTLPEANKE